VVSTPLLAPEEFAPTMLERKNMAPLRGRGWGRGKREEEGKTKTLDGKRFDTD